RSHSSRVRRLAAFLSTRRTGRPRNSAGARVTARSGWRAGRTGCRPCLTHNLSPLEDATMIPARDELHHLVSCLSDEECEAALDRPRRPRGPACDLKDVDQLVFDEDGENVACQSCGFAWDPSRVMVHRPG